jgi:hypothetical protein
MNLESEALPLRQVSLFAERNVQRIIEEWWYKARAPKKKGKKKRRWLQVGRGAKKPKLAKMN